MFSWINKNLDYTIPAKREIMPIGELVSYSKQDWIPYMCHMICIGVLAKIVGPYYAYPVAVIATAFFLIMYGIQGKYPAITAKGTKAADWLLAIGIGVLGIVLWIAPYHYFYDIMFARVPIMGNENIFLSLTYGFEFPKDAFQKVANGLILIPKEGVFPVPTYSLNSPELAANFKYIFLAFRIIGAVVTVAFFEELFIRSFIVRFISDEKYKRVPIGYYCKKAFLIALAVYTVAHPWWLVAIIWGGLTFWLYYYKKNLLLCIVAHATSNLLLALYVLKTGNFYLW